MRYTAIWKDTFRELSKSIMRFLAILVIIFLGVGFYVGISATSPNMLWTADEYFSENILMDYRVLSTYGLTDEDIEALNDLPGYQVQSHHANDFVVDDYSETVRLYSYDLENGQAINQYHIVEGRLPEANGEIALDSKAEFLEGVNIGDTITLQTGEDVGSPEDHLTTQSFEVVGFVRSPLFIEHSSRGSTNIGSGTLNGFGVIPEENYETDLQTEAYLIAEDTGEYDAYTDEYEAYIDENAEELDHVLTELETSRSEEIQEEAEQEIEDGWAEIEAGEQELADAEAELEEARSELDEGWAEYEAGVAELEEQTAAARQEINRNEANLEQALNDLNAQEEELIQQRATLQAELNNLDAAEAELNAGQEQLEGAIAQINQGLLEIENNRSTIEAGLEQIDAGIEEAQAGRAELEQLLENPALTEQEIEAIQTQIGAIDNEISAL